MSARSCWRWAVEAHSQRHPRERGDPASFLMGGWVYILGNRYRGTIYIGVTADLARRTWQHREGSRSAFAAKYGANRLVHAEEYPSIDEAIAREKALKKWRREWKIDLVEQANPDWLDRYDQLIGL